VTAVPSLAYVTITGTWSDPTLTGEVKFTASATVYAAGVPVAIAGVAVQAQIVAGQLVGLDGQPVRLPPTDVAAQVEGMTGFWTWHADITTDGVTQEGWDFFLPSTPSTVDLYATARTGAPGTGVTPQDMDSGSALTGKFPVTLVDAGTALTGESPAGYIDGGSATG
jgi:hypothetical protein